MIRMEKQIKVLCDSVMDAVAKSGVVNQKSTDAEVKRAVEIMRAEIRSFLSGHEYENERTCILAGTMSQEWVLASVVASCISKIKAAAE